MGLKPADSLPQPDHDDHATDEIRADLAKMTEQEGKKSLKIVAETPGIDNAEQPSDHEAARQAKMAECWEAIETIPTLFGGEFELSKKLLSGNNEMPKQSDWLEWKDWGNMLKTFAARRDVDFFDLTEEEFEKLSEDIAALLMAMSVNVNSFNWIREQFPNEEYLEGWNAFFHLCHSILLVDTVHLNRMTSKFESQQGIDLHGLSPGLMFNEFADLSGADLRGCNFSGAIFKNAKFHNADLSDANFDGVTLNGAVFNGANVIGASFSGAFAYHPLEGLPKWATEEMYIKYRRS